MYDIHTQRTRKAIVLNTHSKKVTKSVTFAHFYAVAVYLPFLSRERQTESYGEILINVCL